MKNLTNCSNVEFLRQCNKIRHQVQGWLKETGVLEIRKRTCELVPVTDNMTEAERIKADVENELRIKSQAKRNISDMLDAAMDVNAEKTLELVGLMCFLTPEETSKVKAFKLLREFAEMLNDEDVMGFFSSLMRSGLTDLLN